MDPLVSIITPTFNHERFIAECIESVLRQTFKGWEMIILDDGSTDGTSEIISHYSDPRVKYIREEHRGLGQLGERYNRALRMSRGEFILILEGDDYIPKQRLEVQLESFKEPEVILSHGKYAYVYGEEVVHYPTFFGRDVCENRPIGAMVGALLQGLNPIGTQSVMIRKSALLEVGGFRQPEYLPLVDYPTWMALALKGPFTFIPEVLGYWRRHPRSVTMQNNEQILVGFLRYCDDFVASTKDELLRLGLKDSIENRGALAYLTLSWLKLAEKNWVRANQLARESWNRREVLHRSFKMKIGIAFLSAHLRMDLPTLLRGIRRWLHQEPSNDFTGIEGPTWRRAV